MSKIGRNQACPCGSGHKYKHCHGAAAPVTRRTAKRMSFDELPPEIRQHLLEMDHRKREEREAYGHARPMVTAEHRGYRLVATRNRVEYSKNWRTPADFFGDYISKILNADGWGDSEISKPYPERHPILQWYHDLCVWQRRHDQQKDVDGIFSGVATGSVKAYYALAYDLWTLDQHALLQDILIRRLKNADQFHGARYELYVIAAMIRAGFDVELEDESDASRTHYELTATHRRTGRKLSVEAKSTGRPGMLGQKGEQPTLDDIRTNIYRKVQSALLKEADHERVIFIDVNMPPHSGGVFDASWLNEAATQIKRMEDSQLADDPYPAAFLFFTNHPYHYVGNDDVEPGQTFVFTGINRDDFKPGPEGEGQSAAESRLKRFGATNPEIRQLIDSVFNHTRIPTKF